MRLLLATTVCGLAIAGAVPAQDAKHGDSPAKFSAMPEARLASLQATGSIDATRPATYGDITLNPGFMPDPRLVNVQAGGNINSTNKEGNCAGYVSSAPDFRVNWSTSGSLHLRLSVQSNADTTLVVATASGQWFCDDDAGEGHNPLLILGTNAEQYTVWVGTHSNGDTQPAVLSISETTNF